MKQVDWVDELEEEKPALPSDAKARELAELADEYEGLEFDIAEVEKTLAELKNQFLTLRRDKIPERMQELGIKNITLTNGAVLSYKPVYSGKVLKEEEGFQWLEDQGFADCVKDELALSTSRLDKAALDEVIAFVKAFKNVSYKEKVSIHHMTLGALIKDLTAEGKALPSDLFDVYIGNLASLKKGKSDGL